MKYLICLLFSTFSLISYHTSYSQSQIVKPRYIEVSKINTAYFSFSDGSPYIPIGIIIWDWERKSMLYKQQFPIAPFSDRLICVGPDFLAIPLNDFTIKIWFWKEEKLHTLSGFKNSIRQLTYSPEYAWLIASSDDKTIKIWQFNGTEVPNPMMHIVLDDISLFSFEPREKLLVANGMKGKIYTFKLET